MAGRGRTCGYCAQNFTAKSLDQKFCSYSCGAKHSAEVRRKEVLRTNDRAQLERNCEWCGEAFTEQNPLSPKRFCSKSCSAKHQHGTRPPESWGRRGRKSDVTGSHNPNWKGGKSTHPLNSTYGGMIVRCYGDKPYKKNFRHYGGRGIVVCERWLGDDGFWNFVSDMGPKPDKHSLDRIDVNGPYSPDNCRWATQKEQVRNRRPPNQTS